MLFYWRLHRRVYLSKYNQVQRRHHIQEWHAIRNVQVIQRHEDRLQVCLVSVGTGWISDRILAGKQILQVRQRGGRADTRNARLYFEWSRIP